MVRCRRCGTLRTKGDPCPGAACPKNTQATLRLRTGGSVITVAMKHGFHAPIQRTSLVDDYDSPIQARSWRTAR